MSKTRKMPQSSVDAWLASKKDLETVEKVYDFVVHGIKHGYKEGFSDQEIEVMLFGSKMKGRQYCSQLRTEGRFKRGIYKICSVTGKRLLTNIPAKVVVPLPPVETGKKYLRGLLKKAYVEIEELKEENKKIRKDRDFYKASSIKKGMSPKGKKKKA